MSGKQPFEVGDRVLMATGHAARVVLTDEKTALVHVPDEKPGARYQLAPFMSLVRT